MPLTGPAAAAKKDISGKVPCEVDEDGRVVVEAGEKDDE